MDDNVLFTDENLESKEIQSIPSIASITKEWLEQKYIHEDLGALEICRLLKIMDTKTISQKLELFGIPKKQKGRKKGQKVKSTKVVEEIQSIEIEGEEHEVGDRVRLKENFNSIKATALCEIVKINKDNTIKIVNMLDYKTLVVDLNQLTRV